MTNPSSCESPVRCDPIVLSFIRIKVRLVTIGGYDGSRVGMAAGRQGGATGLAPGRTELRVINRKGMKTDGSKGWWRTI